MTRIVSPRSSRTIDTPYEGVWTFQSSMFGDLEMGTVIPKNEADGGGGLVEKPEWLMEVDKEDWGTEDLSQFIVPPRIKVVQALSAEELVENCEVGSAVLMPQQIVLARKNETFLFTPLFFFPEWVTWNPLAMKGTLPPIRERSIKMNSDIARKARDANRRKEPCPENAQEEMNHCEHLNFVSLIHGVSGLENTPVVLTFSRGDHKQGTNLNALIKMRQAPIYGCVFQATLKEQKNAKGRWWSVVPENPMADPWVTKEQLEAYKEIHKSLKEAQEKIQVDYGDELEGDVVGSSADSEF